MLCGQLTNQEILEVVIMPKKEIDFIQLKELHKSYQNKEISKSEMAKRLMITIPTLNRWIDKYLVPKNEKQEKETELTVIDASGNDKIQVFSNSEFGSIRTVEINNEPWFVGKDVAEVLGYGKGNVSSKALSNAIKDHVDEDDKQLLAYDFFKGYQNGDLKNISHYGAIVINESGLYSLILSSKLPNAKKFKHWVTSEVLPSIRKHGAYMTRENIEKVLYNPDFLIKLATNLKVEQEKNVKLQKENEKLSTVNSLLIKETNEWDDRSLISHLIRKYGYNRYNNKFGVAWSEFYQNLNYKLHINLNHRLALQDNKKKKPLDMIKECEWKDALKIAVAMCECVGINTSEIIKKHKTAL